MNGAGNDFIVLDNRFLAFTVDELAEVARQFCPRRTGVGADGLLALDEPRDAAAEGVHFRMRYRNADGSIGTMCGNGARCLARFAQRAGLGATRQDEATELAFDTDGGRYHAVVPSSFVDDVSLDVPPPQGVGADGGLKRFQVGEREIFQIWTGTEHVVLFTEDVDSEDVAGIGAVIRAMDAFQPNGTNVNFVQVVAPDLVRVRTFEKGVEAETLACGTGALASALATRLTGRTDASAIAVHMPGGTLRVTLDLSSGEVRNLTLAGPAETVYEGTLEWHG